MTYIGSARIDERGKASGGKAGDQTQREVSEQKFYVHSLGWTILRPKSGNFANKIGAKMIEACNNENIGYNQFDRLGVVKNGISTKIATNCDCSSLVRQCIREVTGVDAGNFSTASEVKLLLNTGLFTQIDFVSEKDTPLYVGDILVTKKKGHTAIVTRGTKRDTVRYFSAYKGSATGLDTILSSIGANIYYDSKYTDYRKRSKIAEANGIKNYKGTEVQNIKLKQLARSGKLIKP